MEGFHLTGAAHCQGIMVQDTESCNQVVGCPECGVIAQGHGRVVVEMIDAPWAGTRTRVRRTIRRWCCRENACQTVTFVEHNMRVCALKTRVDVRAIR